MEKGFRFPYWGPFVLETTIADEFVKILLEKGREATLDARNDLAGQIEKEFYYEKYEDWFMPRFSPYVDVYIQEVKRYKGATDVFKFLLERNFNTQKEPWSPMEDINIGNITWFLHSLWINFQAANEYNPPHNHTGDLSFIIYLQVPQEIREEALIIATNSTVAPGALCMEYGLEMPFGISGFSKLPVVGDILIFPAWLKHHVMAFQSDVERISVSGNITLGLRNDKV